VKKLLLALSALMAVTSTMVLAEGFSHETHFDQNIPTWMENSGIEGASVLFQEQGDIVYNETFGYADREAGRVADSSTRFRAESISKTVAAFAVLHMVEEYDLSIDDALYDHMHSYRLKDSDYEEAHITIAHLLSHTSGITGATDYRLPSFDVPPLEEVLDGEHGLARAKMVRPAGKHFEYSNQGFMLLEVLVEDVSGKPYEEYAQTHVLDPLGMKASTFDYLDVEERLVQSYDLDGQPLPKHRYPFNAPGGLYTTAEDLSKLYGALAEPEANPVLSVAMVEKMLTPHAEPSGFYALGADAVGLGVFLDEHDGEWAAFHGGEGAGSIAQAYAYLESGEVVVVMTNSKTAWEFVYTVTGEYANLAGRSLPLMSAMYQRAQTASSVLMILASLFVLYKLLRQAKVLKGDTVLIDRRKIAAAQKAFALVLLFAWFLAGELFLRNLVPILQSRLNLAVIAVAAVMFSGSFLREEPLRNNR